MTMTHLLVLDVHDDARLLPPLNLLLDRSENLLSLRHLELGTVKLPLEAFFGNVCGLEPEKNR